MQTSIDEWRDVACGKTASPWDNRAQIIAKFVRAGDIVLDIGAGDQKLNRFLPPSCGYIPVDCTDVLPGTFVVDFNKEFRLPPEPFNLIVCAGFLEYLNDLPGFFAHMADEASGKHILFTYMIDPGKVSRREMKAHNNLTSFAELLETIGNNLSNVQLLATSKSSIIACATVGSGHDSALASMTPINELIAVPRRRRWAISRRK